jgi:dTDP-glucose 4,6-dehydratase
MAYHRTHGIDTRIARIFNTYGPRMRRDDGRAVPNFITQALAGRPLTVYGDGAQTRSFCFIEDLVEGLYRLLISDVHDPVNLGNPDEITILELAEATNRLAGSRAGIAFHPERRDASDPDRRQPEISRARSELGWSPTIDLDTGLGRTIEDFRKPAE